MGEVKRVFPEAKTGLINWIEENFHEIDSFVATFTVKDGTTMTVYDCHTFVEAMGISGVTQSTITNLAYDDAFIPKKQT